MNIFLIGFMGSGKSAMGRKLARRIWSLRERAWFQKNRLAIINVENKKAFLFDPAEPIRSQINR